MTLGPLTRTVLAPALAAALVATGIATTPADAAARRAPHHIKLPDGFQPTGIAVRGRPRAFVGSYVDGDIYAANLRTGRGRVISQGDGTPALGLQLDSRGRLWVAEGENGGAKVVSVRTGRAIAHYDFTNETSAVTDVVLRRGSAWFTDTNRAFLYEVTPRQGNAAQASVRTVALSGDWVQSSSMANATGISTTPDGRALLVMQTATDHLFRVDPRTGHATRVRLGGTRLAGLGLLRRGRLLYVVQDPRNNVAVIRLGKHGRTGRLVRTRTSRDVDWPTTVASYRGSLYLSNGREMTAPTPTTKYWITRLPR